MTNPGGPPRAARRRSGRPLVHVESMTSGTLSMNRADASSIDLRDLPAAPAPWRSIDGSKSSAVDRFIPSACHGRRRSATASSIPVDEGVRRRVVRAERSGGSPVSSGVIRLASALPSSTPHWSKLLTPHTPPWTNTMCSYRAISWPSTVGVSVRRGSSCSGGCRGTCAVRLGLGVASRLPNASASPWANRLAISRSCWSRQGWFGWAKPMKSIGTSRVPWCSSW